MKGVSKGDTRRLDYSSYVGCQRCRFSHSASVLGTSCLFFGVWIHVYRCKKDVVAGLSAGMMTKFRSR